MPADLRRLVALVLFSASLLIPGMSAAETVGTAPPPAAQPSTAQPSTALPSAPPAAAEQAPDDPVAMLEAIQAAPPRGLLYRVSKGDKSAYLFGTLHVGKADFFPLDWTTTQALATASDLAVELDALQTERMSAALQRHALLAPPKTLADTLPPALLARLNTRLDALGVPRASAQGMKPWMAALTVMILATQQHGYSVEFASDLYVTAFAKGMGKPVIELESADEQFLIFDRLTRDEQLGFLDETLAYLDSGRSRAELESLVGAWLGGDADALLRASQASFREHPRSARWMKPRLFSARNARMAQQVERMLAAGQTPFVAVGALHLVGADGVPALLRQRGWRVESAYTAGLPPARR